MTDLTLRELLRAVLSDPSDSASLSALADRLLEASAADRVECLRMLVNPLPPGAPEGGANFTGTGWSMMVPIAGNFRLYDFARTKQEIIDRHLVSEDMDDVYRRKTLAHYRKMGWRAVRARIVPIPD